MGHPDGVEVQALDVRRATDAHQDFIYRQRCRLAVGSQEMDQFVGAIGFDALDLAGVQQRDAFSGETRLHDLGGV
jgi:hypothetical protein